eukprot:1146990-Pelagomonas_calceolata.AAC.2
MEITLFGCLNHPLKTPQEHAYNGHQNALRCNLMSDHCAARRCATSQITSSGHVHWQLCRSCMPGGVLHNSAAQFLSCKTTQLPLLSSQQVQVQASEAAEKYQSAGPVDVWLDNTVNNNIIQGSVPKDIPGHEKWRVQRISNTGESRVVPHPNKRADLIKQVHEQHGQFGVKRTIALLCRTTGGLAWVDTAFNASAP